MTKVKIAAFGDLHVGAYDGLMFDEFRLFAGTPNERPVIASDGQKELYASWKRLWRKIGPVDILFLMGDICEGKDYKAAGQFLWSSDFLAQAEVAADLITESVRGYQEVYAVQGSGYHTGKNPSADAIVAQMLHANRFGPDLTVQVRNRRFHLQHKVSTTTTLNKTTGINKDLQMIQFNRDTYGPIDAVLRGHAHTYTQVEDCRGNTGVVCPAWKGRDAFARERSVAMVPDCGIVIIEIDDDNTMDIYREECDLPKSLAVEEVISEL